MGNRRAGWGEPECPYAPVGGQGGQRRGRRAQTGGGCAVWSGWVAGSHVEHGLRVGDLYGSRAGDLYRHNCTGTLSYAPAGSYIQGHPRRATSHLQCPCLPTTFRGIRGGPHHTCNVPVLLLHSGASEEGHITRAMLSRIDNITSLEGQQSLVLLGGWGFHNGLEPR